MVALFGIAGGVRPNGLLPFAITAGSGLGFLLFPWAVYFTNTSALMWVADLMEDRVLRTRQNWQEQTFRSLVEVGSWLHVIFRIYTFTESPLIAAFAGTVVGAFCVVVGEYFTESIRKFSVNKGYELIRRLSTDYADDISAVASPSEEIAGIVFTPQFMSLGTALVLAAALYHFQDSQDLGVAVMLATLTNVAFITAEQLLTMWNPVRWAGIILHDRVVNVVHNWEHRTIRSGFETSFYLSAIFSSYCLTFNMPLSVLVGTLAGIFVVLLSSYAGVTDGRPEEEGGHQRLVVLALFGWACASLLYTVFVFSSSSLLALTVVVPSGIMLLCLVGITASNYLRKQDKLPSKLEVFRFSFASLFAPFLSKNDLLEESTLGPVTFEQVEAFASSKKNDDEFSCPTIFKKDMVNKPWVIIEGYVYNIGEFAKTHPGGEALLLDYSSRQADVSDQFAAFHNPFVYKLLGKLRVGKLAESTDIASSSQDYIRLREFLWANGYFVGAESDMESARTCAHQHLVSFSLGLFTVCQVLLLSVSNDESVMSLLQCVVAAITCGFFWQQTAFIAHDALHNGVVNRTRESRSKSPWVPNNVLGWFHGSVCFGISSAMWLDEHNVHHALTMRPCQDAQFNYLPLWCVSLKEFSTDFYKNQCDGFFLFSFITKCLVANQHRTLLPLAVLIGRFNFYIVNIVYAVKNQKIFDLIGMGVFWATYISLVSLLPSSALAVCFVLISHWTVGILHVQLLINHLATDAFTAEEEDKLGFFAFQICTTRNIDSTAQTDWFHGGLQYQIEHHLFPQLPRHRLALIKPAVVEICHRNGLVYESTGFFQAIRLCLDNFESIADEVWSGNIAV